MAVFFLGLMLVFQWIKMNQGKMIGDTSGYNNLYRRQTPTGRNFHCVVLNWRKMTCWYDLGEIHKERLEHSYKGLNIIVYVGISAIGLYQLDPVNVKQNGTCVQIVIPDEYFSLTLYKVQIVILNTARNVNFNVSNEFDPVIYVKPEKIKDFSFERNATSILLRWRHSIDMPKLFCIKYGEVARNHIWKFMETTKYSIFLSKLWPYTKYTITVRVRPSIYNETIKDWIQTGYWSDFTEIIIQTKEDVPIAVPKFDPGYFSQIDNDTVEIYWKPISDREKCGIIQSYRVIIEEVVPANVRKYSTMENFSPDKIFHLIQLDPLKKYKIKLTQRTIVGYPAKSDAYIYIFPEDYRAKVSSYFRVTARNDTQVEVKWEPASLDQVNKEISVYQVVWCNINFLQNNCVEPIESINVLHTNLDKHNVTMVTVSLHKGRYSNYRFGISVVSETNRGWLVGGGITWYEDCIYLLDGIPKIPLGLHIPLDVDQEEGLFIKWTPYSCQQSVGQVKSYVVYICQTDEHGMECKAQEVRKVVPSSISSYRMKDLIEGKTYLIKITAKMKNGKLGPWSNVERVLAHNKWPQRLVKENNIHIVLGGVGAGVFIIIIIVSILILRCYFKNANGNAEEIHLPKIQMTNNHNADQEEFLLEFQ